MYFRLMNFIYSDYIKSQNIQISLFTLSVRTKHKEQIGCKLGLQPLFVTKLYPKRNHPLPPTTDQNHLRSSSVDALSSKNISQACAPSLDLT